MDRITLNTPSIKKHSSPYRMLFLFFLLILSVALAFFTMKPEYREETQDSIPRTRVIKKINALAEPPSPPATQTIEESTPPEITLKSKETSPDNKPIKFRSGPDKNIGLIIPIVSFKDEDYSGNSGFIAGPLGEQPAQDGEHRLTFKKLMNAKYHIKKVHYFGSNKLFDKIIRFKKGEYTEGSYENNNYVDITIDDTNGINIKRMVSFGDLDSDGLEDAAIEFTAASGVSCFIPFVAVFLNRNGSPLHVASIDLGLNTETKSIKINEGILTIRAFTLDTYDCDHCPSRKTVLKYSIIDGELVKLQ